MSIYLGDVVVDIATDETYKDHTPQDWAMEFITVYGQTDSSIHKAWALDQVARILKGTPVILSIASWDSGEREYRFKTGEPSIEYTEWVESMLGGHEPDGSREYDYDEGIAP